MTDSIDYDALKKRGFLRQKQEGFFALRTRACAGNYTEKQILAIANISEKYGRGMVHSTTRQGLEIPFIKFEDIEKIEQEIKSAGILAGTSGPRIRSTTCCPGNNWCKRGLVDTSGLYKRIEEEIKIQCGMDLPHKFKIAISGCPNKCTRQEASDIGIHGQAGASSADNKIGYAVYLGGCGGTKQRTGFRLDKIFSADEVVRIIEKVVTFYKKHGKSRQRLGALIEESGKENFLKAIL